uniref:Uncharacterized protein n=1 Tax=Mus musculus TaxID=10090 RepID=M9QP66_MOUSE|nr:hypothetical protein P70-I [Mus musculus]
MYPRLPGTGFAVPASRLVCLLRIWALMQEEIFVLTASPGKGGNPCIISCGNHFRRTAAWLTIFVPFSLPP